MKLTEVVAEFLAKRSRELADYYQSLVISEFEDKEIISPVEQLFYIEWSLRPPEGVFFLDLLPQYQCKETGKYRLDFAVIAAPEGDNGFLVGIEIDGHIWHEKTKEQVQYHKERERFLVGNGLKLIRFTGSEVFNDPSKCVDATLGMIIKIWKDKS